LDARASDAPFRARAVATPGELAERIAKFSETVELHGGQTKAIARVIKKSLRNSNRPNGLSHDWP
jgi:hypothetical protein